MSNFLSRSIPEIPPACYRDSQKSSFFSFASSLFPAISLGFTIFGKMFAYVTPPFFFNPTTDMTEVVKFRPHGWYMLGVFLFLAFTHLGRECQDL